MLDVQRDARREMGSARLSISLPVDLFRQLDMMVGESGMASRSHLVTGLIRHAVAEHEAFADADEMLTATITLVYRGEYCRVRQQIAKKKAEYAQEVLSSQHVFLEHDQSLEALLVHGRAGRLKELSDALRGLRGVQQIELVATTSHLPSLHGRQARIAMADNAAA